MQVKTQFPGKTHTKSSTTPTSTMMAKNQSNTLGVRDGSTTRNFQGETTSSIRNSLEISPPTIYFSKKEKEERRREIMASTKWTDLYSRLNYKMTERKRRRKKVLQVGRDSPQKLICMRSRGKNSQLANSQLLFPLYGSWITSTSSLIGPNIGLTSIISSPSSSKSDDVLEKVLFADSQNHHPNVKSAHLLFKFQDLPPWTRGSVKKGKKWNLGVLVKGSP